MNKILKVFVTLAAVCSICSCDDFLDEKSPNNIVEENFWKSENDLYLGITAAYSTLTQNYMYGNFEYEWVPLEFRSDEINSKSPWDNWPEMMTFRLTNNVFEINRFWYNQYLTISRANQVIEAAERIENLSGEIKNKYIAEGKFLRSFAYMRLLQNFKYPVYKDKFPAGESEYYGSQPERSVIFAQMEEDLAYAMQTLPKYNGSNNDGRALAGAAAAFLGKTYLYQQKYAEAAAVLKDVAGGVYGPYDLLDSFADNFNGKNENSKESLFQAQFGKSNVNNRTTHSIGLSYGSWAEAWPTQWIFDEMAQELDNNGDYDIRLYESLYCNLPGSVHPEFGVDYKTMFANDIANAEKSGAAPIFTDKDGNKVYYNKMMGKKYAQSEEDMADGWRNTTNLNYMRFADVLLMLAESLNESGSSDAVIYLNNVRQRANMPDVPSGLSKEQMRERIMHERAVELAFEMDRYCDLTRWDAAGFLDMKQIMQSHHKEGIENFVKGKHEYMPVPLEEITNNPSIDPSKAW